MSSADERLDRRRRRRRARLVRWGLRVGVGILLFALGVAVGAALRDNPKPRTPVTVLRTLHTP